MSMASSSLVTSSHRPRRSANYHPSIWGDCFIQYASESMEVDSKMEEQIKILKEEVRKILVRSTKEPLAKINLIDLIQRLGVNYHFEREIDDLLQQIHKSYIKHGIITSEEDLRTLALLFRLLRQQGYRISPDVFEKYKDEKGDLSEKLTSDVEGMLSLYEAAHLRIHGEHILDEALAFTSCHLELMTTQLGPSLAAKVNHSLKCPLRRSLPRLEAWQYISICQQDPSHDKTLLALAKLDFNMLQRLHQKEVGSTFKWDVSSMDFLPEYMKYCYQALMDVYEEIEKDMTREGRTFCLNYAKNECCGICAWPQMKRLVRAYFDEAKWCYSNYTPTIEEYMGVAQVSCAYPLLIAISFMDMGCIATEEAYQWVANNPKIVRASTLICRLMDDIVSSELEQKRKHVASAIECYMKQHGVTKQDAIDEFNKQIIRAWKDINEECLDPTKMAKALLMRVVNLTRVMDVLYKDSDGYTNSGGATKDYIAALLLKPLI